MFLLWIASLLAMQVEGLGSANTEAPKERSPHETAAASLEDEASRQEAEAQKLEAEAVRSDAEAVERDQKAADLDAEALKLEAEAAQVEAEAARLKEQADPKKHVEALVATKLPAQIRLSMLEKWKEDVGHDKQLIAYLDEAIAKVNEELRLATSDPEAEKIVILKIDRHTWTWSTGDDQSKQKKATNYNRIMAGSLARQLASMRSIAEENRKQAVLKRNTAEINMGIMHDIDEIVAQDLSIEIRLWKLNKFKEAMRPDKTIEEHLDQAISKLEQEHKLQEEGNK